MTSGKKEFYQGFAVAVGALMDMFDQPTMAKDIMNGSGISLKQLEDNDVDDFDLNFIRKAYE